MTSCPSAFITVVPSGISLRSSPICLQGCIKDKIETLQHRKNVFSLLNDPIFTEYIGLDLVICIYNSTSFDQDPPLVSLEILKII